ncbi:haloacid dehalogenase-like hydrolase [Streptosporangium sp. NBC_01755]|uniref:HAD family hydrolase n=1 Tax=unclassified Streptosporangium TaxID=2632669 RepID=UPI002DDB1A1E|nr:MULTISPECIES: haloacid dehalogenase-like hydrolase [unclassified Streptosporangium]WSA23857.1 haloacid dehalogenase-like hydrolase [Streptosporangium sp. NBC_01810]WSC98068.1 haloacid dehalogenase-like hydrolase [Streptosporangium sp. NBC_01755]
MWDVDHTLIENAGVSKETYAAAFELLTGRPAEHRARTDGRTDPEIMRDLLERHDVQVTPAHLARFPEVLTCALAARRDRLRQRGHALPGAREAIAALGQMPGVIQSVLTGNVQPNAFTKVEVFNLHGGLDFEVGGYGSDDLVRAHLVEVARNRARAKYQVMLDASSTVLIGDTIRDIQAARRGGAVAIGVASGPNTVAELLAEGADVALADLADTAAVVKAVTDVQAQISAHLKA